MSVPGSTGFDGGVTAIGYQNSIEVFSYSDGMQACAQTSTRSTSQVTNCSPIYSGFYFMIQLSPAISAFQKALLQGKALTVDVTQVKNVGGTYKATYLIHMENVIVTSLQAGAGGDTPNFTVQLQPAKIRWTVTSQNDDGSQGASYVTGWDFIKNVAY